MSTAAPFLIGILRDHTGGDGGDGLEKGLRLGIADVAATGRLDREVELISITAEGLPRGTAHAVEQAFFALEERGVLGMIGPAISDNGLFCNDLADGTQVPCINYTGGERTRSEWMFHYQIGSLEEEGPLLARHLAAQGHRRVALVVDHSPIGKRYSEFFEMGAGTEKLELVARRLISPVDPERAAPEIVSALQAARPDAVVYLGLGLSAHAVASAIKAANWNVPCAANSALMFGYMYTEWRAAFDGWTYCDGYDEANELAVEASARLGYPALNTAGPMAPSAYDMGRLIGEGLARADHHTRAGLREGLERIKQVPAALGRPGTLMGFGHWERSALKGEFLVLRQWKNGESVIAPTP